jgi:hypothetical protein
MPLFFLNLQLLSQSYPFKVPEAHLALQATYL